MASFPVLAQPDIPPVRILADRGVEKNLAQALGVIIQDEVEASGKLQVQGRESLALEEVEALYTCSDTTCLRETGISVPSPYLLVGRLSQTSTSFTISLKLLSARQGLELIGFDKRFSPRNESGLIKAAKQAVSTVMASPIEADRTAAMAGKGAIEHSLQGERFLLYDNGTVKDTKTGLTWAMRDNGADIDWLEAKRYCDNSVTGGFDDWRLPTQKELEELFDFASREGLESEELEDVSFYSQVAKISNCCLWASEAKGNMAKFVNFRHRYAYWDYQTNSYSTRVLPVRGGR